MEIFDITRVMQKAPRYPGTPPFSMQQVSTLEEDGYNERELTFYSHVGTHADAQSHFLPDGRSIDEMPPERYVGPCRVLSIPGRRSPASGQPEIQVQHSGRSGSGEKKGAKT